MRNIFLACPATGGGGREEAGSASMRITGTGSGGEEWGRERGPGWEVVGVRGAGGSQKAAVCPWDVWHPREERAAPAALARSPEPRRGCCAGGELAPATVPGAGVGDRYPCAQGLAGEGAAGEAGDQAVPRRQRAALRARADRAQGAERGGHQQGGGRWGGGTRAVMDGRGRWCGTPRVRERF